MQAEASIEPSRLTIDYPDRELNRLTTFFRLFVAIPIMIVLGTVAGGVWEWSYDNGQEAAAAAGGVLFFGPLLMILFRQKYPRWWFDFNLQLVRFSTRVWSYLALMSDRYPSSGGVRLRGGVSGLRLRQQERLTSARSAQRG
jgi:hypothetical protein